MINQPLFAVFEKVIDGFDQDAFGLDFNALGVDSFDLLTLRVALESELAVHFSDQAWVSFRSAEDISDHLTGMWARPIRSGAAPFHRTYNINMPQMALGGLSESWFLREIGDLHWTAICHALKARSDEIFDGLGNRLYATFVRVRWESSHPLAAFAENAAVDISGKLFRCGKGMFFSEMDAQSRGIHTDIRTMTTFALRGADNRTLLKGEPSIGDDCAIEEVRVLPSFSEEYRAARKGTLAAVHLAGIELKLTNDSLFEIPYALHPFYEFNGVNLLYFAAYPMIAEHCERLFVHSGRSGATVSGDWALEVSTEARDVFYFANCDIDDAVVYVQNSFQIHEDGRYSSVASLHRESDRELLCRVLKVGVKRA